MTLDHAQIRAATAERDLRLILDAAACEAEDDDIDERTLDAVVGQIAEYRTARRLVRAASRGWVLG